MIFDSRVAVSHVMLHRVFLTETCWSGGKLIFISVMKKLFKLKLILIYTWNNMGTKMVFHLDELILKRNYHYFLSLLNNFSISL